MGIVIGTAVEPASPVSTKPRFMSLPQRTVESVETVKGVATDPEVSVDEAFYASLLMESSEIDEVYEKLTGALAKDHPLLFQAIHASLRSHHGAFADAAKKFSSDRGFVGAFTDLGRSVS